MTAHALHADVHIHGLADGCPRCDEHAANPLLALDADMVAMMRRRIAAELEPRSNNEAEAMRRLEGREGAEA